MAVLCSVGDGDAGMDWAQTGVPLEKQLVDGFPLVFFSEMVGNFLEIDLFMMIYVHLISRAEKDH